MTERAYDQPSYRLSEVEHEYGSNVHVLADPLSLRLLSRLCSDSVTQPAFNELVRVLYQHMFTAVVNAEFPTTVVETPTRMQAATSRGVFRGAVTDARTELVVVDIARAGILPAMVCYELANRVFEPSQVRQDHLVMARQTAEDGTVRGAAMHGQKVGGTIDGRYVLFPDPMGATGASLAQAIRYYKDNHGDTPARIVTMNLIITPEFVKTMKAEHPDVIMYALRLDRGMSDESVFSTRLGERPDGETGLNDVDYIVPGGGGFGELMNNSWV